uniref:PheRS DNA binding domain-containing protein n=1 Tax=Acrobeloides nanus TaxID=290746 RepID=A0A914CTZ3_9BILA
MKKGWTSDFEDAALLETVEEDESLTTRMLAEQFDVDHSTIVGRLKKLRKFGNKYNMRLGPHSMKQIRRQRGWTSTFEYEEMLRMNPMSKKKRQSLVSVEFKLINASKFARTLAFV